MSDNTTEQTAKGDGRHHKICMLGSEGSGKTCFLAGLAILREPNRDTGLTITCKDNRTIEYLDELADTLRKGQWPPPTNMTIQLMLRICRGHDVIEALLLDYPGEDFRAALAKLKREEIAELYQHYTESETILLLFDPERDVRAMADPALQAQQIERQLAHLQAIADCWAERSGEAPQKPRIFNLGIVVTKADKEPSLQDSRATKKFFQTHARALDDKFRQHAKDVNYFPVSAIGKPKSPRQDEHINRSVGSKVEPSGYEPLLTWVMTRGAVRRLRKRCALWLWLLGIVVAMALVGYGYERAIAKQLRKLIDNPSLSRTEILDRTRDEPSLWLIQTTDISQRRAELVKQEVGSIQQAIQAAADEPTMQELLRRLEHLETLRPGVVSNEIGDTKASAQSKMEGMLLQKTKDAFDNGSSDFTELAARFLGEYPASPRCDDVREWLREGDGRELRDARKRISIIRVDNRASLGQKSDRIVEFLQKFKSRLEPGEADRMLRAATLAKQFCELNTYTLRLKSFGGFATSRSQSLQLFLDGQQVHEFIPKDSTKTVTWDGAPLRIQWRAEQPVKVVLYNYTRQNAEVAFSEFRDPLALRILGGRQPFARIAPNWETYVENPFAYFVVEGITPEDWQSLRQYILPGEAW